MSYFDAPIATIKDANGRCIQKASVVPTATVNLRQVYELITQNEQLRRLTEEVRQADDLKKAKTAKLPFVTPCGTFPYRQSDRLDKLSGLLVLDIDHLPSHEEAQRVRDELFGDVYLNPALCFVSPGGCGVKAFVPYPPILSPDNRQQLLAVKVNWAMEYLNLLYDGCDKSGTDAVRTCFLCHDAGAKLRQFTI